MLCREALLPDMYHGTPFCMSQYKKLFGCRAPGPEVDTHWHNVPGPETRHFIVMRKGHVSIECLFLECHQLNQMLSELLLACI